VPVTARTVPAPVPEAVGDLRLLLALWILVIVGFYSLSRGQQDLYVLPFVAGAAPLIGGLLVQWTTGSTSPPIMRVSGVILLAVSVLLGGLGAFAGWTLGDATRPIHLAGAMSAGVVLGLGALASVTLMLRRARPAGLAAIVAAVICVHWIAVLRTLPDFDRYKHVPQFAREIQSRASPAGDVCTYKLATPSLTFLLRRHVLFVEEEGTLRQLMQTVPDLYCMMPEEEYRAVRNALGVRTTRIADVSVFPADLKELTGQTPLRRVVLVTNRVADKP
jgi:4-amino-4-deoxy-L-arabinose transferase-like glycosyltransferase